MTDQLKTIALRCSLVVALAAAVLLAYWTVGSHSAPVQADPDVAIGIDADTTGNTATSLGTIQSCRIISAGQLGLSFTVDFYVKDVVQLLSYEAYLSYDPTILRVNSVNVEMFQDAQPASNVFNTSEDTPDQDGLFRIGAADQGVIAGFGDTGTGVLARLTLVSLSLGTSPLSITPIDFNDDGVRDSPWLKDSYGDIISPDAGGLAFSGPVADASVIVGTPPGDDADGDTIIDPCDSEGPSPNTNGVGGADDCSDGVDNDGDGFTDGEDTLCDADNDAVPDVDDLCPGTGAEAVDANGCADSQVDQDGDDVCDPGAPSGGPSGCTGSDNCPSVSNPSQTNTDGDANGDACDSDDDNDGTADVSDNCPLVSNPGQGDYDGDGLGDACDADADNDGFTNTTETYVGTDPLDECANTDTWNDEPDDRWSLDFNDDQYADIFDLTLYITPDRHFETDIGTFPGDERFDIFPGPGFPGSTDIDIIDLTVYVTVAPPMFGGPRAFALNCIDDVVP